MEVLAHIENLKVRARIADLKERAVNVKAHIANLISRGHIADVKERVVNVRAHIPNLKARAHNANLKAITHREAEKYDRQDVRVLSSSLSR